MTFREFALKEKIRIIAISRIQRVRKKCRRVYGDREFELFPRESEMRGRDARATVEGLTSYA